MEKICSKCKIKKIISDFAADKNTKSGVRSQCKKCIKEKYFLNRSEILSNKKNKYNPEKSKKYYLKNTNKINKKCKEYYNKKKNDILLKKKRNYDKESKKEYYLKNKEKLNKSKSKKIAYKRKNDFIFKLKHNTSCLIRNGIKRKGYIKSKKTEEIIGCTINELMNYLGNMFLDGMSFDNHGEWHIDHIIPISSAKNEQDVIKLNRYTNLQPLWAKDNLSKGKNL